MADCTSVTQAESSSWSIHRPKGATFDRLRYCASCHSVPQGATEAGYRSYFTTASGSRRRAADRAAGGQRRGVAAAILDRVLHHATVIIDQGQELPDGSPRRRSGPLDGAAYDLNGLCTFRISPLHSS
jgi:hypothetical protein